MVTLEQCTVARHDRLVDIERRIADEAMEVAMFHGITRAQYLSDLLRKQVHADYLAALKAKLDAAQGDEPKPSKRKRSD
jgi:hypothetical protein